MNWALLVNTTSGSKFLSVPLCVKVHEKDGNGVIGVQNISFKYYDLTLCLKRVSPARKLGAEKGEDSYLS